MMALAGFAYSALVCSSFSRAQKRVIEMGFSDDINTYVMISGAGGRKYVVRLIYTGEDSFITPICLRGTLANFLASISIACSAQKTSVTCIYVMKEWKIIWPLSDGRCMGGGGVVLSKMPLIAT